MSKGSNVLRTAFSKKINLSIGSYQLATRLHIFYLSASSTGSSLDGSVDEYNEQGIPKGLESRRETRFKNIVHLWEFLLELLANENCRSLITWSNKSRWEFKIRDPDEVAKRWGQYKRIKKMTYDKLSRALRYYYTKGIISKVRLVAKKVALNHDTTEY